MLTATRNVRVADSDAARSALSFDARTSREAEILVLRQQLLVLSRKTRKRVRGFVADGVGLIVAAGGGGTINEVAEGMIHSHVPLGILPAGTANVLAAETGLSTNLEKAAHNLRTYIPERISVGRLHFADGDSGVHHFLLAGIGLDARVIYNLSAPLKANLGKVAYWIASFSLIGRRSEEFSVEIEDRIFRCSFALISKVRNYGGDLEIARNTCLFDDQFEVVLFEEQNSLRYVRYFVGVVLNRLRGMKGVRILRAAKLRVSASRDIRVYVQMDGEYAGLLPGCVEIVKDAITLLMPPLYKRGAFNCARVGLGSTTLSLVRLFRP